MNKYTQNTDALHAEMQTQILVGMSFCLVGVSLDTSCLVVAEGEEGA